MVFAATSGARPEPGAIGNPSCACTSGVTDRQPKPQDKHQERKEGEIIREKTLRMKRWDDAMKGN